MRVVGLNGSEYSIDLKKYSNQRPRCSKYHKAAREVLSEKFNGYSVYEEVKLPGSVNPANRSALYLDFFIPNANLGIEVHGEQHFKFVPYFHKSKAGWLYAQMRDRQKISWCELNGIELVVFRFDESKEDWRKQIDNCC